MIIASETGRSAIKALDIFKETKVKIMVVTHYPAETWGPKGNMPIGLRQKEYAENLKNLKKTDAKLSKAQDPSLHLRVPPIGNIQLQKA